VACIALDVFTSWQWLLKTVSCYETVCAVVSITTLIFGGER
jgi:hypothetical protein